MTESPSARPRRWVRAIAIASLLAAVGAASAACGDAERDRPHDATPESTGTESAEAPPIPIDEVFELFNPDPAVRRVAIEALFTPWNPAYASLVIEAARYSEHRAELLDRLGQVTGRDFEGDLDRAYQWLWTQPANDHPEYARFKAVLYQQIDSRFASYFDGDLAGAQIRLDEVRWGGVRRDGIPPLDRPAMISASEAGYLDDDHIVFGIEVEGEARAYPKRILAWHEMFRDEVGGVPVNGVYCTLCGTMILYRSEFQGRRHVLGTSGFLYRSNKLMYDRETESLWSTIRGEPVLGPLVGAGIRLEPLYAVTTTWGRWRELHPDTQVLSLETGFERDYGEGVAYREYFATDELMFQVPYDDRRLNNKDEVLALRFGGSAAPPTAIVSAFLAERAIYQSQLGAVEYAVLTDGSGAHRVYQTRGERFASYDGARVIDSDGRAWRVAESELVREDGVTRPRLPAHRAFWFGWHAAHPDTELVGADG